MKKKFLMIIAGVLILLSVATIVLDKFGENYKFSKTPSSSGTETQKVHVSQRFKSRNLDFEVQIPKDYEINEKLTFVELKFNQYLIDIIRNGTNFDLLEEYLENFDKTRKLKTEEQENELINNYQAVRRIETNLDSGVKEKVYYFFVDSWVYTLSTSSESFGAGNDFLA